MPPSNVHAPAPYARALGHETTRSAHAPVDWVLGSLRLVFGAIFLWAFLDKLFGLGYATERANAWLNGGSPTAGFLGRAATGPFQGFYHAIAGHAVTDSLFMVGLLLIGVSLLLGIGVRVAAYSGALLNVLMWSAILPPANHPFLDDHLVHALALVALALTHAGRTLGFGSWWERQPLVRRYRFLA